MTYYVHKGTWGGVTVGCPLEPTVRKLLNHEYEVVGGAFFYQIKHSKPKPDPMWRYTTRGYAPARFFHRFKLP